MTVDVRPALVSLVLAAGTMPLALAESNNTMGGSSAASKTEAAPSEHSDKKPLQTSIRVFCGTKLLVIMLTPIDSDASQDGSEFSAKTAEDLSVDASVVLPAGSIIKGRITLMKPPVHLNRSSSVKLKFETVTTPDNRQIPFAASVVSRGEVLHVRRGLEDIAMETGIGVPILLAKRGKKVDLRAGDALRIELVEDLRIPAI
jgi:hypothetical protein